MGERRPLGGLCSYRNVNGYEALGRRVREERMELERTEAEGEREVDVLLLRRRRLYLDQEGVHLFARYNWYIMAYDENSFRHKNQKRVLRKMLAKELIPFIYKNMTDFPFEECWPITGDQFEALDHNLSIKFPKLHAGRPWRAIERSADLEEAWHADAILFRRFCKIPLDQEGAHVFTIFCLAVMIGDENVFRFR